MIETFEYLSKTSFSKSGYNFKSVTYMLALFCYVLVFIVIKPIILNPIWSTWRTFCIFALVDIQPVNCIVIEDFLFFYFH